MDEWLLDRVKQLTEIEERLDRIRVCIQTYPNTASGLLANLHADVKDMLRRAEEEYRAF